MALYSISNYGLFKYCSEYFGSLYRSCYFSAWKITNTRGQIYYSKSYKSSKESQVDLLNSHKVAYSIEYFEWACRCNFGIFAQQISNEVHGCNVAIDEHGNVISWSVRNYILGTKELWKVIISDFKDDVTYPGNDYCVKNAEFVRLQ